MADVINTIMPAAKGKKDYSEANKASIERRLAWFSDLFEIEPPALSYDPEDPDGGPLATDDFIYWMRREGVSFDWLVCGAIEGPIAAFREKHRETLERKEWAAIAAGFEDAETRALTVCLRLVLNGLDIDVAMEAFRNVIEAKRSAPEPEPMPKSDVLPDLVAEWRMVCAAWTEEARKPGAGNFDTPECLRLEARRDELEALISGTVATSTGGTRAQLEWVIEDHIAADAHDQHVRAMANAVTSLRTGKFGQLEA